MDIRAPLSGVMVPLVEVPDSVFAKKMVGDGAAIDPTSSDVLSPIDGTVTQLHAAHHAMGFTSSDGVEVLVHVGIDTVQLKGKGFTPLVALGTKVKAGQPVLRFDADVVARSARSLITVVIVTNLGPGQTVVPTTSTMLEAGKSVLFTLSAGAVPAVAASATPGASGTPVKLPNANGLHARPAAVVAQEAKRFTSTVWLTRGAARANAKSVVGVMGLSTKLGDEITVEASGADAAQAIEAVSRVLREGSGETATLTPPPAARSSNLPAPKPRTEGVYEGVGAAPGIAVGRVVKLRSTVRAVVEIGGPRADEQARLTDALRATSKEIEALEAGDHTRGEILRVQRELLEDPELVQRANDGIGAGKSAAFAWQRAFTEQATKLSTLDQPLLRERAVDVRDVGERLLRRLAGETAVAQVLPDNAIVVAEEVTPSQLATFSADKLKALVTTTGSATSHVAILARGMGVAAVCGIDATVLLLTDGTDVVVDGTKGLLTLGPVSAEARAKLDEDLSRQAAERENEKSAALSVGQTRDGRRIEVVANIKNLKDAKEAIAGGAEGVGLLRSEFMFFDRDSAPSEDEQSNAYRAIAQIVGKGRPLVVRTLDVGGDKPLSYWPLPKEDNPFLGMRGIRVSLDRPDLFRVQIRAMLKAAELTDLHIMFPMVAGLEEVRTARQMVTEEQRTLGLNASVKIGIMIEVPSAVVLAEKFAREVDFFSIGTNDLTQYALAMDRGHPQLAKQADALHPAVLKLIAMTVEGARVHRRPVHVCGGLASDPLATPLLVGLGITELSVSVPAVGAVKAALARWSMAECVSLAEDVLAVSTTAEVRALLTSRQGGPSSRVVVNLPTRAIAKG